MTLRAMCLANGKASQLAEAHFILDAPPAALAGKWKCISEDCSGNVRSAHLVDSLWWEDAVPLLCQSRIPAVPVPYSR